MRGLPGPSPSGRCPSQGGGAGEGVSGVTTCELVWECACVCPRECIPIVPSGWGLHGSVGAPECKPCKPYLSVCCASGLVLGTQKCPQQLRALLVMDS